GDSARAYGPWPKFPNILSDPRLQTLCLEVSDTGIGIATTEQNAIFEAFEQTTRAKKVAEGSGLGLTLTHHFVTLMGGSIALDSNVGRGTTFRIFLPIYTIGAAPPVTTPKQQRYQLADSQTQYRILVVDDRADNRLVLVHLLEAAGFEIAEAGNGREAIEMWASCSLTRLLWICICLTWTATQQPSGFAV
ncbi:MAG: hybrid sensor histidine kinase/response regulator, partial [Prochlorothrix sp.]